jgi:hypothetical protein
MSREPRTARSAPAAEPELQADPAAVLGEAAGRVDRAAPYITIARADGVVWIDLAAERQRLRVLEELFNVALGRSPDSTRSLIDQTTATPKVTKVREAALRMGERLSARGFQIVWRG